MLQPSLFATPAARDAYQTVRRDELQRRLDRVFPARPDADQVDAAARLGMLGRDLNDEDVETMRRLCREGE